MSQQAASGGQQQRKKARRWRPKPEEIYADCLEVFDQCREQVGVSAIAFDPDSAVNSGRVAEQAGHWNRQRQATPRDFCDDFAQAGYFALGDLAEKRPRSRRAWLARRTSFRWAVIYGYPFEAVNTLLYVAGFERIPRGTFDWWLWLIRPIIGSELQRRKIFPIGAYFGTTDEDLSLPRSD